MSEDDPYFAGVIGHAPVGICVFDAQLCFKYVNPKATPSFAGLDLLGRTSEEVLQALWPAELAAEVVQRLRDTLETGEPFRESAFSGTRRDSGAKEYYDWETHRITFPDGQAGVVCYFMDVEAHVAGREALRRSEEELRALADSIPQLAWIAAADGSIFWYNRGWYDYTGTTLEEMQGWGWQKVHDPGMLPLVMEGWTKSIRTGEPFDMEFPLRGADGTFRWFLTRVNPFRDAEGNVVRWFGTNTDVDRVKRAEADRERLLTSEQEARQQAEREMQMKDEFMATVSHELRTPLNAILGWTSILRSSTDPAEIAESAEVIERNARAQAQLIEDLLDVSRIISGKVRLDVQRVDLVPVINAALESVRPTAAARDIRLTSILDPIAGPVSGDPARLQQILWNLLTNALKFTPKGGRVQIILERVNSHLDMCVIDNGEGIAPELLPHVFDRFRQGDSSTTRRHRGLGLGLAIVKNLVELHGGTVRVKSAGPDQGSTFAISLPVMAAKIDLPDVASRHPSAGIKATSLEEENPSLQGLRVLTVDDEPDARELVRRILSRCGAEVDVAASGEEALLIIPKRRPHVLVMDIGMPGEDGYSAIRRVRQLSLTDGGDVPAIALTAFARSEDRRRAVLAGFQMHMSKPVEPAELVAMVASLGRRREVRAEEGQA